MYVCMYVCIIIINYVYVKIRAANLSGDCFFWKENFARLKFGWKQHHQVIIYETFYYVCVNYMYHRCV